ncbi:MAG: hypothetical protein ACLTMP_01280 [Eggerthella lenta]
MREIIRKVPIPTAGVALGLAALGNLLQPYTRSPHVAASCRWFHRHAQRQDRAVPRYDS